MVTWLPSLGTTAAAYLAFAGYISTAVVVFYADGPARGRFGVSMVAGLILYPFVPLVVLLSIFSGDRT